MCIGGGPLLGYDGGHGYPGSFAVAAHVTLAVLCGTTGTAAEE